MKTMHANEPLSSALQIKARWVAELMKADKVIPEMVTPELVEAYFPVIARKIEKFQNIYITIPEAKEFFAHKLLSLP